LKVFWQLLYSLLGFKHSISWQTLGVVSAKDQLALLATFVLPKAGIGLYKLRMQLHL
jgi:hypothetical protein